jgi:hypothetical protein
MAYIQDIKVNIIDGAKPMTQKGFGLPLIVTNREFIQWYFSEEVDQNTETGIVNEYEVKIKIDDEEITINATEEEEEKLNTLDDLITFFNKEKSICEKIEVSLKKDGEPIKSYLNFQSNLEGIKINIDTADPPDNKKHLLKKIKNINTEGIKDNGTSTVKWYFNPNDTETSNADVPENPKTGLIQEYKVKFSMDNIEDSEIEVTWKSLKTIKDIIHLVNEESGFEGKINLSLKKNTDNKCYLQLDSEEPKCKVTIDNKSLFTSINNIENSEDPEPVEDFYKEYSDLTSVSTDYHSKHPAYLMAGAMFSQSPCPPIIAIYSKSKSISIEDSLNKMKKEHNGFYAVFISERGDKDNCECLHQAGKWAAENEKLFFGCSKSHDCLTKRKNEREAYIIHDSPEDYPECAWAGQNLPKTPGSITWKWKALNNQKACNYDTTYLNEIRNNNGQALTELGGIVYVNEGKTTVGQFIDVIRGKDWIKARMLENLYILLINNEKIPLDNTGIAQVEGVVRTVLKQAAKNGIIARATTEDELKKSDDKEFMYTVSVPTRSDLMQNDIANRILKNVGFVYYLAGAIHEAEVQGKIDI